MEVGENGSVFYRLPWFVGELTRQYVGIAGVFVEGASTGKPYRWAWPLRVGCLPTPKGRDLCGELTSSDPVKRRLAQIFVLDSTHPDCDVLLSSESVRKTV